ncbi:TetR/AcrR family transcriptional regulator [Nocardioides sp. WV_118_6]
MLGISVDVFNEKGFDGTSMEDLSKRLGITKSAIYHHIDSKDELLGLALDRALDNLEAVVAENRTLAGSPVDRLEHLLRGGVAVLVRERKFVTLLLRVRGNTPVERAAMKRRRELDDYLSALVTEASEQGLARPDLDPHVSARLVFGLVNSLTDWVRPRHSAEKVADDLVQLAFHGLLVPTRRRR